MLEEWTISVEETKDGSRVEIHAIAPVRHRKEGKAQAPLLPRRRGA